MKNIFKNLKRQLVQKGLSLVEVLVAIAISMVTLTTAAVFSNALLTRSQRNFAEVSANQLQNLVVEQMRLIEYGMKRDIDKKIYPETGGYVASTTWQSICAENTAKGSQTFFSLGFPQFSGNDSAKINIQNLSYSDLQNNPFPAITNTNEGRGFAFYQFTSLSKFGPFNTSDSPVYISIRKSIDTSLGTSDNLKTVRFDIIVAYRVLGRIIYTKPQSVKMIYSLICKTTP